MVRLPRDLAWSRFEGGRRPRVASAALGVFAALVLAASPVLAAPQTQSTTLSFTGSTNPSATYNLTGTCDACVPDDLAQFFTGDPGSFAFGATATTAVTHLDWSDTANVDVNYDDSLLRQGQTLGLSDVLTAGVGHIHASGTIGGNYGLYNDPTGGTNFAPVRNPTGNLEDRELGLQLLDPAPGREPQVVLVWRADIRHRQLHPVRRAIRRPDLDQRRLQRRCQPGPVRKQQRNPDPPPDRRDGWRRSPDRALDLARILALDCFRFPAYVLHGPGQRPGDLRLHEQRSFAERRAVQHIGPGRQGCRQSGHRP